MPEYVQRNLVETGGFFVKAAKEGPIALTNKMFDLGVAGLQDIVEPRIPFTDDSKSIKALEEVGDKIVDRSGSKSALCGCCRA